MEILRRNMRNYLCGSHIICDGGHKGLLTRIAGGEFTLCLCAQSYTTALAIYGFNFCSNYNLCAGNAYDFIPSHILMLFHFQAIFGDSFLG